MQNHYNLVYREEEREMLPLCLEEGIGVIPWSPLARGFLSGSRRRGAGRGDTRRAQSDVFAHELYYAESDFLIVDRVKDVAGRRGVSPSQVALAWLLAQPGVAAPIIGTTRMAHLDEALSALSLKLTDAEEDYLEEPYSPHPVLGHS